MIKKTTNLAAILMASVCVISCADTTKKTEKVTNEIVTAVKKLLLMMRKTRNLS
jgi:hypothetical protein